MLRRALLYLLCSLTLLSAAVRPKSVESSNPTVRKWMRSMSLRDKVAQLIIMPIFGEPIHARSATFRRYQHFIRDLHVGGIIVTGNTTTGGIRNAEPYAMAAMLNRLQKISKVPLLVAADFERGASMRVTSTTAWPYNMAFAAATRSLDPDELLTLSYSQKSASFVKDQEYRIVILSYFWCERPSRDSKAAPHIFLRLNRRLTYCEMLGAKF